MPKEIEGNEEKCKNAINRVTNVFHVAREYSNQDGVDIPIDSEFYKRLDTFQT